MDGFVVVTTPQSLAALDAKRSINMIKKLNVNVLGVVENFTGEIFGSGAGEHLANELDLPFLGSISLRANYRDDSQPTILGDSEVKQEYDQIWKVAWARLESSGRLPEQITTNVE